MAARKCCRLASLMFLLVRVRFEKKTYSLEVCLEAETLLETSLEYSESTFLDTNLFYCALDEKDTFFVCPKLTSEIGRAHV